MRRYRSSFKPRSLRKFEKNSKRRLVLTFVLIIILVYGIFTWGLPTLVESLAIFNKFKPQTTKPQSIEDAAIAPPVLNIPFEATGSSILKITGYTTPNSKVEIYFDDEVKTTIDSDSQGKFQTEELDLAIGTNNIFGRTLDDKGNKSLPSKNIKLIYNNEKPALELSEPPDGKEITGGDKKVRVSGKSDSLNSVSVNGSIVILDAEGNFTTEIPINEGENRIEITATNKVGNSTKEERRVIFKP